MVGNEMEKRHWFVYGVGSLTGGPTTSVPAGGGRRLRHRSGVGDLGRSSGATALTGLTLPAASTGRFRHGLSVNIGLGRSRAAAATRRGLGRYGCGTQTTGTRVSGGPGLSRGTAAGWTAYGSTEDEDPADARHRFSADQTTLFKEPFVGAVELLKRIVGEDRGARLVGDLENERVSPANGASRRRHQFTVDDARFELFAFAVIYAVPEGCVDHDGERDISVGIEKGAHGFIELSEAGGGSALGCNVGSVDNDVFHSHVTHKSTS